MKYFTNEMKHEIRELLLKYGDYNSARFEYKSFRKDGLCLTIIVPLQLPYDILLGTTRISNSVEFRRYSIVDRSIDKVFEKASNEHKLTKNQFNELINVIDLDFAITSLDNIYLDILTYEHSFEKTKLKQYNDKPFGLNGMKDFLTNNENFYIVYNKVSRSNKPFALVNEKEEYVTIDYDQYKKLSLGLQDAIVKKQLDL